MGVLATEQIANAIEGKPVTHAINMDNEALFPALIDMAVLDANPDRTPTTAMESNGGVMSAATASKNALQTLLSGPVGGAIGGKALAPPTGGKI